MQYLDQDAHEMRAYVNVADWYVDLMDELVAGRR